MNDALWEEIKEQVRGALGSEIYQSSKVTGGDINEAFRVEMDAGGNVFLKAHASPPPGMFFAEADALSVLEKTQTLRVPRVLGHGERWLALEWIEPGKRDLRAFDEALGRGIAQLHKHRTEIGYRRDNYIGTLKQENTKAATWVEFFAQRRLMAMAKIGATTEKLPADVVTDIEWLCQRLTAFIDDQEAPSQLHGDLWGGNLMCDASGAPVLCDPAVYGGDREVDLAMMHLFGGFSPRVFSAYGEAFPLRPGASERMRLYQLYPLLVHACMFGGGYVGQVKSLVTSLI